MLWHPSRSSPGDRRAPRAEPSAAPTSLGQGRELRACSGTPLPASSTFPRPREPLSSSVLDAQPRRRPELWQQRGDLCQKFLLGLCWGPTCQPRADPVLTPPTVLVLECATVVMGTGCRGNVRAVSAGRVCRGSAQSARVHAACVLTDCVQSLSISALPRDALQAAARGHPGLRFTTPLRESAGRHLQVGSGPQAAKQRRGTQPQPAPS